MRHWVIRSDLPTGKGCVSAIINSSSAGCCLLLGWPMQGWAGAVGCYKLERRSLPWHWQPCTASC